MAQVFRSRRSIAIVAALLTFVAVCVFVVFRRPIGDVGLTSDARSGAERYGLTEPPARPAPPENGYVGSEICAKCHAAISERYQSQPMRNSLARVDQAVAIENYSRGDIHPPGPRTYRVEKRQNRVLHREIMLNGAGKPMYDQEVEIAYVLGFGKRGRSYLHNRDGFLFQSSIAWYTELDRFDLAATYPPEGHPRFERRVEADCLACHAGRVALHNGAIDRRVADPIIEAGIGCERCHGPGERHVAFRNQAENGPGEADPIVNPRKLNPPQRESVCNQCHLHGIVDILRYGRSAFDFRPGQSIEEIRSVFDEGTGVDELGASKSVTHVSQMRASACFRESNGEFGCITCHAAHGGPPSEQKTANYDRTCLACHERRPCTLDESARLAAPASGSCVHCHMPTLATSDIAHSAQTDHRIRKDPSVPDRPPKSRPNGLAFMDDADKRMAGWEVDRARGLAMFELAARSRDRQAMLTAENVLAPVAEIVPKDIDVLGSLAQGAYAQGRYEDARALWEKILGIEPENERALRLFSRMLADLGDHERGVAIADRLVRVNPWVASHHASRARLLHAAGRRDDAIDAALRSLMLDPTQLPLHELAAEWLRLAGRTDDLIVQLEMVRQMRDAAAAASRPAP